MQVSDEGLNKPQSVKETYDMGGLHSLNELGILRKVDMGTE